MFFFISPNLPEGGHICTWPCIIQSDDKNLHWCCIKWYITQVHLLTRRKSNMFIISHLSLFKLNLKEAYMHLPFSWFLDMSVFIRYNYTYSMITRKFCIQYEIYYPDRQWIELCRGYSVSTNASCYNYKTSAVYRWL